MKTLITITCLMLGCAAVRAGNTNSAATGPVVNTAPEAAYTPKTKSVFTGAAQGHNPFWPIGWVKLSDEPAIETTAAPYVPKVEDFVVTTIMLNDPPMAVINGKDMAEGEIAALPVSGQSAVVQLMAVQDGRVILRWENQNLVVPIHRDEDISSQPTQPTTAER
jgi:hypothetical protein